MSTELAQGAGVGAAAGGAQEGAVSGQAATGAQGDGGAASGTVAAGLQPIAGGEQPGQAATAGEGGGQAGQAGASLRSEGVDLTALPEFRRWQAGADRREAQLRSQLMQQQQATAQELQALRFEMQQAQLADADPEQVAAFYQQQLQQLQQTTAQQQQEAEMAQVVTETANEYLTALGLERNTPGLDWGEGPTMQQLPRLMASAKVLADQRATTTGAQQQATVQSQIRQAKIDALDAAGITQVGLAGGSGGGDNPIENVDDPSTLFELAWGKKDRG